MGMIEMIYVIIAAFLFCLLSSTTEAQNYLHHNCSNTANFTMDSTYGANLNNRLLPSLSSSARNKLFDNNSFGTEDLTNAAYGLFLCRGDVSADACHDCVVTACLNITQRCGNNKEAVIWFDECMLRYANRNIFSRLELSPKMFMYNVAKISDNEAEQVSFDYLVQETMLGYATDVAENDKKYGVKDANYTAFISIYSLLQCTPDLSHTYCRECLQRSIFDLRTFTSGKIGGRIINPSCIARFEVYQFYDNPTPPPASLPSLPPTTSLPSLPPTTSLPSLPPTTSLPTPPPPGGNNKLWIIVGTSVSAVFVLLLLLGSCILYRRRSKKGDPDPDPDDSTYSHEMRLLNLGGGNFSDDYSRENKKSHEFPSIRLSLIATATQNFSDQNKLGEGGFGPVYKGVLVDGKEIAVKRLARTSGQGLEEFKNEITLIAKLQHRNLVRLLGCCLERKELLLIYEYMPNKSLDVFLFDRIRSAELDWERRLVIINGIARGILYLHEDSRLRIIHRDLKASNVLLDNEMNPKISDFGMARIFGGNQVEANTNRVVGTYGYMAPEYAMEGVFSVKSDVYSFGVLLLEIISGKRNGGLFVSEHGQNLVTYAWKLWCDGRGLELMDPNIEETYVEPEVLKCIQIGLLCVQDDPADRPTMSYVAVMLRSDNTTLPQPMQPMFPVGRLVERPTQSASSDASSSLPDVSISIVSSR